MRLNPTVSSVNIPVTRNFSFALTSVMKIDFNIDGIEKSMELPSFANVLEQFSRMGLLSPEDSSNFSHILLLRCENMLSGSCVLSNIMIQSMAELTQ